MRTLRGRWLPCNVARRARGLCNAAYDSRVGPVVDEKLRLADGTPDYTKLILTSRVYDVLTETPLDTGTNLSTELGAQIMLKREDLTPVFSFKLRGAYNLIAQIPADKRQLGVIACSAGNHAQGVAYGARKLGMPATIVMPTGTPSIKVRNVARLGAKVVLFGDDFDSAKTECTRLSQEHGIPNIPPFDHPFVIAGQGTVGLEILRQTDVSKLKAVFCAVGGGGLIAGIGAYVKRVAPHVRVIGVETYDANAMKQSLDARGPGPLTVTDVGLFADGTAVKTPGTETYRLCQQILDEIVLVSTDEICAAIKDVFEDTRSIVEPSGALSVAGARRYLRFRPETQSPSDSQYVCVLSGANMNFNRLRFVSERAFLGEGSEVFMVASIPERPGSFLALTEKLMPRNITEFSYRFNSYQENASVYISFASQGPGDAENVRRMLSESGVDSHDVSDNEFAKAHARYMVGGRTQVPNERVFQFEFPDRPKALYKFLTCMRSKWNITMFHYRNHGSDIGKVLIGFSVDPQETDQLQQFLHNIRYPYVEETANPVYRTFLLASSAGSP